MGSSLSSKKCASKCYSVHMIGVTDELNDNITEIVYCKEGLASSRAASSSSLSDRGNSKPGKIFNHAFVRVFLQTGAEISIDYRSNGVTFNHSFNVERSNMMEMLRVKPPFLNAAASDLLPLNFAHRLAKKWIEGGEYNPLTRNCQHFAVYLFYMCIEGWKMISTRNIERLQNSMKNAPNNEIAAKLADILDITINCAAICIARVRLVGQEIDGGMAGVKWG